MNAHSTFMDKITEDDVVEAEQNVLACILANNEVLSECGLEDIDFADPLHQSVFAAAQKLYSSHQRINADRSSLSCRSMLDGRT
ncbi:DnaB-like helicase N-terminal domain-containing protein [Rhizobium gallicum]|uniref:DnaB-like helicase N-terminal domain-containing protein n=1 Tax=Rhizobium gallicum TaxID=56730 RepID=UPI0009FB7300|nr:DnaB-like helicase N-terminal domain-containing protein [Rhizobium gallicum]